MYRTCRTTGNSTQPGFSEYSTCFSPRSNFSFWLFHKQVYRKVVSVKSCCYVRMKEVSEQKCEAKWEWPEIQLACGGPAKISQTGRIFLARCMQKLPTDCYLLWQYYICKVIIWIFKCCNALNSEIKRHSNLFGHYKHCREIIQRSLHGQELIIAEETLS